MAMTKPRILFLDAYDSFSNNIVSLLTQVLDADVDIVPIDSAHLTPASPDFRAELRRLVGHYDAVVCGPGPGSPNCDQAVGLMKHVWDLESPYIVPVLGICLGFQSLVVHCGGIVKKLSNGLHGMIREINHAQQQGSHNVRDGDIFSGVPAFKATLYHSLCADVGQDAVPADGWDQSKWQIPAHLPDIVPLAWVQEDRGEFTERILMGVKHSQKPFWGLQYHPESVCTEATGHQVIHNWFREAARWNQANGRTRTTAPGPSYTGLTCRLPKLPGPDVKLAAPPDVERSDGHCPSPLLDFALGCQYYSKTLRLPTHVEVPDIVEVLQSDKGDFIVLDSASAKTTRTGLDVRGRYSILALDVDEALKLEYRAGAGHVILRQLSEEDSVGHVQLRHDQTIWKFLADFWSRRSAVDVDATHPFLGGFMGYTTYELGLEGIDVRPRDDDSHNRPDLSFAWITRSAVVDHMEGTVRVQMLSPTKDSAEAWITGTAEKLLSSAIWSDGLGADFNRSKEWQPTPPLTPETGPMRTHIQVPDADEYESKVGQCQEFIAAGDSYELCLTDQTFITRPRSPTNGRPLHNQSRRIPGQPSNKSSIDDAQGSWDLYRMLRSRNPAPFGSYIKLGGATLVSSSPERFLEFTASGLCSMRPMKGTVRKSTAVSTLAQAEEILHVPKEEAENLMIVDLVRHDLHAVCGAGNVSVPQLLKVEEYASVFQMISVVEGQLPVPSVVNTLPAETDREEVPRSAVTGLDVLAASLPPGSMTGAPKKRSCEILQGIEGHRERSLYSGVVGYMDVRGFGDWSVTIRSLFRWDDEGISAPGNDANSKNGSSEHHQNRQQQLEVWHIGAGGAVTALSTPAGERDEMFTKLKGPLGIFEDQV